MATITKRGNSYRIRVSAGYDVAGKQIMKSTTWTPEPGMTPKQIEKELERQKVLFEEKCKSGQYLDGSIRFADFAEKWFTDYAEKQLRPKTVARYSLLLNRINPALGHIRLDKLQPHHLMSFYDNLTEEGIREDIRYRCLIDFKRYLKEQNISKVSLSKKAHVSIAVLNSITQGKNISAVSADAISKCLNIEKINIFEQVNTCGKLSPKTILHHHRLLSSILSTAVQWQVMFSNPCERVKPPKVERTEAKYLDENEAKELLECLEGENIQNKTIVKMLLYTGMRRGELCGLEWSDIDFVNALVHIRRSSLYLPEKGIFTDETKTQSSVRTIKIPEDAVQMLKMFQVWQTEQRLTLGNKWINTNRLFTTWNGDTIHPDTVSGWFHKFIAKNNLPQISIHSLRHTNATLLIAAGVSVRTVSDRLGHAQPSTTSNIYSHAIRSADAAAADTLQNIFNPVNTKLMKKAL